MPLKGQDTEERVLVLYTELAPYVLACLNAFVERSGVKVDLVRWPVNPEAPFDLKFHPGIAVHERNALDDRALMELAQRTKPSLVLASGWVDKGYLNVCRALRRQKTPTVMTFDTAWRGGIKQMASATAGRLWIPGTFSHAWATGTLQARYARMLGFSPSRIRTGFYAADTAPFMERATAALASRNEHYPHRFISVARYISSKGQQLLCDAFATLVDEGRAGDWELHFVGVGELYEAVKESSSGRHPRIVHHGFVQADAMPEFLQQAGVSVVPSLYEPWGVVVQEHACMGLPLLLSDAVGSRERFLREGENGFVQHAGDRDELKNGLLRMIGCSDMELVQMGRRSAELGASWTPDDWAEQATELLNAPA